MPIPKPNPGEKKEAFVGRCMGDAVMNKDYPDNKQRAAICYGQIKNNMETYSNPNTEYEPRTVLHQGRNHIIVPVVMMTEGVHKGSHGAVFHSISELGKFPESWNGIPVSVQHPKKDGRNISANHPEVIDSTVVGRVYNTRVEGSKLKAEAWLEADRLKQVSPLAAEYIEKKQPLEVSLGMFTEDESSTGDWQGEAYDAVALNHRPDHLALLPGGRGACSWKDGCGIRANEENDMAIENNSFPGHAGRPGKVGGSVGKGGGAGVKIGTEIKFGELPGQAGYSYKKTGEGWQYKTRTSQWKKVKNKDLIDVIEDFASKKLNNKGAQAMANENEGCCPEKVEMLIQDENSNFTEDDREWLLTQSEEIIEKLQPVVVEKEVIKEVEKIVKVNEGEEVTKEQAIQVLSETLSDPKKFMELLPSAIKDQLESGLRMHEEYRDKLITGILANQASEVWKKEDLANMNADQLKRLSDSIGQKQAVYRMAGGAPQTNSTEEKLLPPGL